MSTQPGAVRTFPVPAGAAAASRRWLSVERVVALLGTVLIAWRFAPVAEVSVGALVAIALLPVWWSTARRYVHAPLLGVVCVLAVGSGLVLAEASSVDHTVLRREQVVLTFLILGGAASVGFLLWARDRLPVWALGLAYGTGLLLAIRPNATFMENPWRFGFSTPVTVLALSLALTSRRRAVDLPVVLVLAAVSAASGGRSRTSILLIVALLVLWQLRRPARHNRLAVARGVAVLGALGYGVYTTAQALILEGFLGDAARDRTMLQLDQSGSLLVGGRPEMAATWALMRDQPWGHGLGVVPHGRDVAVAKTGFREINYDPNNGYVENFMFGNGFVLHSVFGELWAWCGILGLVLALALLAVLVVRTVALVNLRQAPALVLFPALVGAWNVAFGPVKSAAPFLVLALALLLAQRDPDAVRRPSVTQPEPAAPAPDGPPAPAGARRGT